MREHPAPFNPQDVTRALADEARRWGVRQVVGDAFSGAWVEEAWRSQRFTYRTARQSKSQYYLALLPMMTTNTVRLLDDDRLLGQFGSLLRRTTRTTEIVDHPSGASAKDDRCNAAAGALVEAGGKGSSGMGPVERFKALASGDLAPLRRANIFYPNG